MCVIKHHTLHRQQPRHAGREHLPRYGTMHHMRGTTRRRTTAPLHHRTTHQLEAKTNVMRSNVAMFIAYMAWQ